METRKVLLSLSGKSADAINFYFNGCHTEETSDGLLFYNPEGELVCKACFITSFSDYFLRIKNTSTRKFNLYNTIGKPVVMAAEWVEYCANDCYMIKKSNIKYLYNAEGVVMASKFEDAKVFPNGCYSVQTLNEWSLYNANRKCLLHGAQDVYVYANGFYKEETLDYVNHNYTKKVSLGLKLHRADGTIVASDFEDADVFSNGWYALQSRGTWTLYAADGEIVATCMENVYVFDNGWYRLQSNGVWKLYTADGKIIVKDVDHVHVYYNGWYIVEKQGLYDLYNSSGKCLIAQAELVFVCDNGWYSNIDFWCVGYGSKLYDKDDKLVVADAKSIHVYENGWYGVMSVSDNLWTLYNSAREKIVEGCKEIKFIKSHGIFFLEKDGIPWVFEACATRKELQAKFLNMVDSSKNLSIEQFEYLMNCLEILGWDKN